MHGLIKIGLVAGLWYNKLWTYPATGIILSLLVIYQIIRFSFTHSVVILLLTIVDITILALMYNEYKQA